ncbi:DUF4369 domain-containing protein [Flavisolibacter tropicus]|uniref:DUF4369 domain-containing protein n=1 Tax=Flavisolibacter tropicus TaxID=1492898 RepID=A0A172TXW6_9BACT|nr:DUF4369 domain-containing protein [Flavisolibacter tropicus]ANE51880.1 hypothetical protein SY85_16660 [Flavisolibacter tropicus]
MKKPLLLFLFTLSLTAALFPLTALSNDSSNYKQFYLTGKVTGLRKGNIYLRYTTEDFGTVWDSCVLRNGSFHFNGKVNEPTMAEISLDREMPFGPDRAEIFLEEGNLNIKAIKNSFNTLQMNGTLSQMDYERLSLTKRKVLEELFEVQKKLNGTNTAAAEKESLEKRALLLYKEKAKADSLFIVQNPGSFVTAYLIKWNMDVEQFSLYPVDDLYNQMPAAVKMSSYGKKILWHMNKVKKYLLTIWLQNLVPKQLMEI